MSENNERSHFKGAIIWVLLFNLLVMIIGVSAFASYYTPGNPIRPQSLSVDIIGVTGIFIGISQLLYIIPLLFVAYRQKKFFCMKGVGIGALITAIFNALFIIWIIVEDSSR